MSRSPGASIRVVLLAIALVLVIVLLTSLAVGLPGPNLLLTGTGIVTSLGWPDPLQAICAERTPSTSPRSPPRS